ncbi:MAG: hypothetical protein WC223_03110 [Bacteroidales bacterium]|jgi:hypothetical protein
MNKFIQNKYLLAITPIILYIFLFINGALGIRFGGHWDESIFIICVKKSIISGTYLPHKYIYPSFCYYLILISGFIYKFFYSFSDINSLDTNYEFYVYIRYIFLAISSLCVIWVYILTFKVTKNYFASLIAGLIICSSFEFSYHSKWAVTDCIAVQFAILSTLILFFNLNANKKIIFSSLIAGIAAGTKYTAGLVCLNIIIFIIIEFILNRRDIKIIIKGIIVMCLCFLVGFIFTTPGAVFEFKMFIDDLIWQKDVYSNGHFGYAIQPGIYHFNKIFQYVIFVLFSKNVIISILIFIFSLIGFIFVFIRKEWNMLGLFIVMLIYAIYVSFYKLMIVRNLLYILPYFAILSSFGFINISGIFKKFKLRISANILLLIVLLYSTSNVLASSLSIYNKKSFDLKKELNKYIKENVDKEFILSLNVSNIVNENNKPPKSLKNAYLVFYKSEIPYEMYTANIYNQFQKVIGIDDINLNYYPTWSGDDAIIIMKYINASKEILFYSLKRIKFINKYISSSDIEKTSKRVTYSDKYLTKVNKYNPYGIGCKIKLIKNTRYFFYVWRKNDKHTGSLVIDNNSKLWKGTSEVKKTDKNGWELLELEYFSNDTSIKELSLYTWQPDVNSDVYFDDLTVSFFTKK